jgi:TatA/E family protein of Tat protein translocase
MLDPWTQSFWLLWTPGPMELLLIFGIALLIFGSRKLADIGKGLGEGIRNFKKGLKTDESAELEAPENDKHD